MPRVFFSAFACAIVACGGGQFVSAQPDGGDPLETGALDAALDTRISAMMDARGETGFTPDAAPPPLCHPNPSLDADPAHCGACDHSCGSDTCSGGMCALGNVITGLANPEALVVGPLGTVYLTLGNACSESSNGTVDCPAGSVKAIAASVTEIATLQDNPAGIALDAANLYWADASTLGGLIMHIDLGAGTAPTPFSNSQTVPPRWVAAKQGSVVWASPLGTIGYKLRGLAEGSFLDTGSGPNVIPRLSGIAFDAANTRVYFSAAHADQASSLHSDGFVKQYAVGSSGASLVADGLGAPLAVAVAQNPSDALWSEFFGQRIARGAPGGGVVPIGAARFPRQIAVDGPYVYFTDFGSETGTGTGTVNRMPLAGGAVLTLAAGRSFPDAIAVGSDRVFWVERSSDLNQPNGSVRAVAK